VNDCFWGGGGGVSASHPLFGWLDCVASIDLELHDIR
jgi:hypothetical protein